MQVESGIAMQNLKPTIDNIKRLYGDDKKKIQRETSELYKKAKIRPLAGKQVKLFSVTKYVAAKLHLMMFSQHIATLLFVVHVIICLNQ